VRGLLGVHRRKIDERTMSLVRAATFCSTDNVADGRTVCAALVFPDSASDTNAQSDGRSIKHAHSAADSIANTTTRWLLRTSP
jgi:hypothetical protein